MDLVASAQVFENAVRAVHGIPVLDDAVWALGLDHILQMWVDQQERGWRLPPENQHDRVVGVEEVVSEARGVGVLEQHATPQVCEMKGIALVWVGIGRTSRLWIHGGVVGQVEAPEDVAAVAVECRHGEERRLVDRDILGGNVAAVQQIVGDAWQTGAGAWQTSVCDGRAAGRSDVKQSAARARCVVWSGVRTADLEAADVHAVTVREVDARDWQVVLVAELEPRTLRLQA